MGNGATALKNAVTIPDILAALERRVSERTLQVLMAGALYLQPGEERRRSGSHYTPRKLTQPIVETTLRPIFEQLGVPIQDLPLMKYGQEQILAATVLRSQIQSGDTKSMWRSRHFLMDGAKIKKTAKV